MQSRLQVLVMLGVVVSVAVASGCGKEHSTQPVNGTVVFKDGTPVKSGSISFSTKETRRASSGTIAEDGTFKLTTYEANDGAEVGPHIVTVSANPDVDPKYASAETSGIEVEVKEGANDIKIELDKVDNK